MNQKHYSQPDLVCMCHLRWDFVFQRPQHLMSRFARERRVFFVEEPVFYKPEGDGQDTIELTIRSSGKNVEVITPRVSESLRGATARPDAPGAEYSLISELLHDHFERRGVQRPVAWFYSPMALDYFPRSLSPALVIYDCMDELSLFKGMRSHPPWERWPARPAASARSSKVHDRISGGAFG
jgi:hypothetical protein